MLLELQKQKSPMQIHNCEQLIYLATHCNALFRWEVSAVSVWTSVHLYGGWDDGIRQDCLGPITADTGLQND